MDLRISRYSGHDAGAGDDDREDDHDGLLEVVGRNPSCDEGEVATYRGEGDTTPFWRGGGACQPSSTVRVLGRFCIHLLEGPGDYEVAEPGRGAAFKGEQPASTPRAGGDAVATGWSFRADDTGPDGADIESRRRSGSPQPGSFWPRDVDQGRRSSTIELLGEHRRGRGSIVGEDRRVTSSKPSQVRTFSVSRGLTVVFPGFQGVPKMR